MSLYRLDLMFSLLLNEINLKILQRPFLTLIPTIPFLYISCQFNKENH